MKRGTATSEIRDIRKQPFFWLDNQFVDNYMPKLTHTAALLYLILCRYTGGSTQQCWPSQSKLAEMMQIKKRDTIRIAAKQLAEVGLIGYEQVGDGPQSKTVYTLLHIPPVEGGLSPLKKASDPPCKVSQTTSKEQEEPLSPDGVGGFELTSPENGNGNSDPSKELKTRIRNFIQRTIEEKTGIAGIWDASESTMLAKMVRENKSWTVEDWGAMLTNWRDSDAGLVRFGDRPRRLLSNITRFADGPVERLGKDQKEKAW